MSQALAKSLLFGISIWHSKLILIDITIKYIMIFTVFNTAINNKYATNDMLCCFILLFFGVCPGFCNQLVIVSKAFLTKSKVVNGSSLRMCAQLPSWLSRQYWASPMLAGTH